MSLLPVLPWVVPFAALPRLARKSPNLGDVTPVTAGPKVSVIIPARNEAATLATVVRSVLASRYANVEVIVVDDRSTDGTADLAARLAAEPVAAGRLRLVAGVELPDGDSDVAHLAREIAATDAESLNHEQLVVGGAIALRRRLVEKRMRLLFGGGSHDDPG